MESMQQQRKFEREFKRTVRRKAWKRNIIWLLVILLIAVAASFLVNFMPVWYDQFVRYKDPVYRPMDIERKFQAVERERGGIKQQ